MDCSHLDDFPLPPKYYLQDWNGYLWITKKFPLEKLMSIMHKVPKNRVPNYVVFAEKTELENRVKLYRKYYPDMKRVKVIEPGFIEWILHKMNPNNNRNNTYFIYHLNP